MIRKKTGMIVLTGLSLLFVAFLLKSGGSPGAKTGSPADGANCTQCHGGSPTSVTGWISTTIGESGYVPGETYTITATGTHGGVSLFGFELTAEDDSDAKKGLFTITNSTETKLENSNTSVTHTLAGTTPTSDAKSWSFVKKAKRKI